jgi:hypothetical protein
MRQKSVHPESPSVSNYLTTDSTVWLQFCAYSSDLEGHSGDGGGGIPKLWEMSDMVKVLEDWEVAN